MNTIKSKHSPNLTDNRLTELLWTALTTHNPNFKKLKKKKKNDYATNTLGVRFKLIIKKHA